MRHLVSVDDLSLDEIREIFERAKTFAESPGSWASLCPGLISASLFYEPSTRTRLSFESAMLRLGGGVITAAEMDNSSAAKGESLADTARVVSGYADIIVLRHPSEGAARHAAQFSKVPVINAGDGSHEHPTQTLCDLYTLWIERGRIEGIDVVLAGDLKYSRTVHSFAFALARFGANLVCVPHRGLELPQYVLKRLLEEYGVEPLRADASRLGALAAKSDVMYMTPQKSHQLALFTDMREMSVEHIDAVYMTRPQTERFRGEVHDEADYLSLGSSTLSAESLRDAVVMHPLPRRDEISSELDEDPRSIYFQQAARGVPLRMAILAALLGRQPLTARGLDRTASIYPVRLGENPCPNPTCISRTEVRHVTPAFRLTDRYPLRAACGYCSHELEIRLVGCSTTRHFHRRESATARQIRPDHLVFFRDEEQAQAMGFSAAR